MRAMKISIINGSPKLGKSTSELMIDYLFKELGEQEIQIYSIAKTALTNMQITELIQSDALILVFPLYVDSIPSHLLRQLIALEAAGFKEKEVKLYCIINNGFFEGEQNHIAVCQIRLWGQSAGLIWGQGFGIGAGEMYPLIQNIPLGYGPKKNLGYAIKTLAQNILTHSSAEDTFLSVNWPRFLWRIQASTLVWYPRARVNGLKKRELRKQIEN